MNNLYIVTFVVLSILPACQSELSSDKMEVSQEIERIINVDRSTLELIVNEFDKNIKQKQGSRPIHEQYIFHSKALVSDFFNKLPDNLNYPYREQDELDEIKELLFELSFISKECGFIIEDKLINFPCLSDTSQYMKLLEEDEETLLQSFSKDYKKSKTITPNMRFEVITKAYSDLDFSKMTHRSFYVLYHYLTAIEKDVIKELKSS